MPSPAMIEGRAILDAMLPEGALGPDVTIRAYHGLDTPGIAFTLHPPVLHSWGGEYRERVVLPNEAGRAREQALDRLRYLLERWVETEDVARAIRAETLTGGGEIAEDGEPTPAWRIHCPLPLRLVMDEAGLDDEERRRLADGCGDLELAGFAVRIREISRETSLRHRCRSVTRIEISRGPFRFSQGINRCYVTTGLALPQTILAALGGRPIGDLADAPGFAHPAIRIIGLEKRSRKDGDILAVTRSFSMLAPPPNRRTPT